MTLFRKPLLLHYYVTTACNCRCSFCNIPFQKNTTALIGDVFSNLESAKKLGVKFVDFTGGEPLLYGELPVALKKAKDIGFITSVTTNGILLKKRTAELKGLIDLPRLSIDGSENVHNSIRGADCYKHAIEGLSEAVAAGLRFDIIFTLTKENIKEIDHVYSVARKYNSILILDPSFSYFGNDDFLQFDSELEKWSGRRGVYVNKAFVSLRKMGGNSTEKPVCRTGEAVVVISPENKLMLPCYHAVQETHDINGNLGTLWNDINIRATRKMSGKYGSCEGCTINCYMDPSFCYQLNSLMLQSMLSKAGYALEKWIIRV